MFKEMFGAVGALVVGAFLIFVLSSGGTDSDSVAFCTSSTFLGPTSW
jgi:hypothetical protein